MQGDEKFLARRCVPLPIQTKKFHDPPYFTTVPHALNKDESLIQQKDSKYKKFKLK